MQANALRLWHTEPMRWGQANYGASNRSRWERYNGKPAWRGALAVGLGCLACSAGAARQFSSGDEEGGGGRKGASGGGSSLGGTSNASASRGGGAGASNASGNGAVGNGSGSGSGSGGNDSATTSGGNGSPREPNVFSQGGTGSGSASNSSGGLGFGAASTSGGNPGFGAGGGPAAECSAGAKRCDSSGKNAQVCGADGRWSSSPCPFVCTGDSCGGSCSPGARKCNGAQPQRCNDAGAWVDDGQACAAQCDAGTCTGSCRNGDTQCTSADAVQTCANGKWGASTSCMFACVNNGCGGVCSPGETKCATGTATQTCSTSGQWGAQAACDFVCAGKACGGRCKPGNKQCSSNTELQTCGSDGEWGAASSCTNACVNNACGGDCRPGTKRCGQGAGSLETCNASGKWEQSSCPATCVNGACATCQPNASECVSATQVKTCNGQGAWGQATSCKFACVGGKCGGSCVPGSRECVAGATPQYRVCNDAGEWGTPTSCDPSPACVNGKCGEDPKLAFVTSTLYTGNLGGVSGADAKCQERAKAANLSGTFKAWISDNASNTPNSRFTFAGGPIKLVTGTVIAKTWAALKQEWLLQSINVTEFGTRAPNAKPGPGQTELPCHFDPPLKSLAWSNTQRNGLTASTGAFCNNWTTTKDIRVAFGDWSDTNYWSKKCSVNGSDVPDLCATEAPIYCFQQ